MQGKKQERGEKNERNKFMGKIDKHMKKKKISKNNVQMHF